MVARLRDGNGNGNGDGAAGMSAVVEELARELAGRDDVLPLALDAAREYSVSAVNAPVFDHAGRVTLALSLTGFAAPLTGRQVAAVGDRLAGTTDALTAALQGVKR